MESRLLIGERVVQSILMVIGGKLTPSSGIVSFLNAQQIFNDFLCQLFESTTLASPLSDSSPRNQRCRLHCENFDFPIFSLNQASTMDTTQELASDCEVEEVVLNNLVSSQLAISDNPEEDWKIFEKIVFDDQAKSYNRLDAKSSMRIFSEFQKVDRGKKQLQSLLETSTKKFFPVQRIKCSHCLEVFTPEDFDAHACSYDLNQQPIKSECAEEPLTEFQEHQRLTVKLLLSNNENIQHVGNQKKIGSKLECFKCCRTFVHSTGLDRHYDRHLGDLLEPSPPEDKEKLQLVTLCVLCSQVFWKESDAWKHLQEHHVQVVDSHSDHGLRVPKEAAKDAILPKARVKQESGEVRKV